MFSYTGPGNSVKDQVRFLVGDTRPKQPFLQDEEIQFLLNQNSNDPGLTAIQACEAILSYLARSRDETVGSVSISFSQAYAGYEDRLQGLKLQYALSGDIMPFSGGISRQEKREDYQDRDWVRPDIHRHMMRSPWVAPLLDCDPTVDWEQWPLY